MKNYRVTAENCRDYKVGQIVELSDNEAKNLVNKVELVEEAQKVEVAEKPSEEAQKAEPQKKPAAKPKAKRSKTVQASEDEVEQ